VGPYAEVKSSDFNLCLKMLGELADLQFRDREFQTAGALTEKALADKANVTLGTVSRNSIHAIQSQYYISHRPTVFNQSINQKKFIQ